MKFVVVVIYKNGTEEKREVFFSEVEAIVFDAMQSAYIVERIVITPKPGEQNV